MGYGSYSLDDRTVRAKSSGWAKKSIDDTFTQQKSKKIHESMNPFGIVPRICANSEAHPNTVPIILCLDVTGSMGKIPHQLIKDGLPTMMSSMIQRGVADASLMFVAIGDHECDKAPLQVAQFESGDAELDMWLTRTWIEGNGGGNAGESYLLGWYAGAFLTDCEAFTKQGRKGFLITIGDEPNLASLPASAIKEFIGSNEQKTWSAAELLGKAQEKWNVYHLHVTHSYQAKNSLDKWKSVLGQHCIEVEDYTTIANVVADIVSSNVSADILTPVASPSEPASSATFTEDDEIM